VSDLAVVLAKFFGSLIFYTIVWLPLLAYMLILQRFIHNPAGSLDLFTILSTYLGIILVGGLFISVGCFASSLSKSQLIAARIELRIWVDPVSFKPPVAGAVRGVGWEADFFKPYLDDGTYAGLCPGVVGVSSMTYYVSLTIFFLFLTWKVVESRRWK
jgi:ABC-2 type transport system permease protein